MLASSYGCAVTLWGLQVAGAALQGPRVGVSPAADTRRQVTSYKAVTLAALQMPRRRMASMMKPQRRCPVVTEMRGRRSSLAQVCSVLAFGWQVKKARSLDLACCDALTCPALTLPTLGLLILRHICVVWCLCFQGSLQGKTPCVWQHPHFGCLSSLLICLPSERL